MTPEDAFIQAILDSPDDDTPRLIFADWLDENGHGRRAEFIRLQIERGRLPLEDPQRVVLYRREERLLLDNAHLWLGPLAHPLCHWHFRRGFLEQARLTAGTIVQNDEQLSTLGPLHTLTVSHLGGRAEALAECRCLSRVASLHIDSSDHNVADLRVLLASPHLDNLTGLWLGYSRVGTAIVEAVLSRGPWSRLTSLGLSSNNIDDRGAALLAETTFLPRLTTLDLSNNPLTSGGFRALAESLELNPDLHLTVTATDISPQAYSALHERFPSGVRVHMSPPPLPNQPLGLPPCRPRHARPLPSPKRRCFVIHFLIEC